MFCAAPKLYAIYRSNFRANTAETRLAAAAPANAPSIDHDTAMPPIAEPSGRPHMFRLIDTAITRPSSAGLVASRTMSPALTASLALGLCWSFFGCVLFVGVVCESVF